MRHGALRQIAVALEVESSGDKRCKEAILSMTVLAILVALFVERFLQRHRPLRRHRWFDVYCRQVSGIAALRGIMVRPWGAFAALLPPLLVIAWLQAFFDDLGPLFAFAFATLVLLNSLGPRDLGDDTQAFVNARDTGQDKRAQVLADDLCIVEPPEREPHRSFAVAQAVVVLAARRLVGPIFWFLVFGALGAASYRLVHLLAGRLQLLDCPVEMRRGSDRLCFLADWVPARITAAGYAVAGNFDAVAQAWGASSGNPVEGVPLGEAEALLARTGIAALGSAPGDADLRVDSEFALAEIAAPPMVEDALALVWRSLAIGVALIAGGGLVAALA
jgi:AmpE protein